jgi:hypothetical protein
MGKRVLLIIGVVVLVLAAAAGGFFYGRSVGKKQATQALQQAAFTRFRTQGGQVVGPNRTPLAGRALPNQTPQAGAARAGGVMGTITAIEGNTLVINTQEGTVRVKTTENTLIEKMQSVTLDALKTGEQIVVLGSRGEDGTITARSIQSVRAFQPAQSQ